MTDKQIDKNDRGRALREAVRGVRKRYDQLDRGRTAPIRRCRAADEVALEGAYWRIGDAVAREQYHLPHVVLSFPLATHATSEKFSFGRHLRKHLSDNAGASLRFRRLVDSRDRDELDHRLRGILKLTAGEPVDWGVLGVDILWFFAESGGVRRRWAQDFYAPTFKEASGSGSASPASSAVNA
jgi:CRISPR type I-E-associated protein CasB/Cse2